MFARRALFALALTILVPALAWAQPVRHKLPSGLTVITQEDHEAPVVSFQVWVRAGSAFEKPHEYGITHLIEHMIFKGSPRFPQGQMAGRIEALGGEVNAYTTYDHTKYYVTAASRYAPQVLELLADAVVNASFDPKELAREKEVVIEEIRMGQDSPARRFSKAVFKQAFGDHPYGRPVIGSKKSVRGITRQNILNYRARWYRAPNMVVVAVGDFDTKTLMPRIKKVFAALPSRPAPRFAIPPVKAPGGPTVLVMREKVRQASLALSWVTPGLPSPQVYGLDMAASVLGQGRSSRLWSRIKEKQRLVDAVSAFSYTPRTLGLFSVRARLAPASLPDAWRPLLKEALSLVKRPPSPAELKRANVNLAAEFIRDRETMQGQASTLGYFEMMHGGFEKAAVYLDRFRGLGPDEVAAAVRANLAPARVSLVLQLPEGAPAPDAKELRAAAQELAAGLKAKARPTGKVVKKVLANGLTVIVKPRRSAPLLAFSLVAPGGQAAEPKGQQGLYALWAKSITRGTQRQSYGQLTNTLESLAASISGFAGKTTCGLSGSFLSRDWEKALELLGEIWLQPAFRPAQVQRAKAEQLAALRAQQDRPTSRAFLAFRKLIYGGHPYAPNPLGSLETVMALGPKQLMAAQAKARGPGNLVLAVVGDVDPGRVLAKLEKVFGQAKGKAKRLSPPPPAAIDRPRRENLKYAKAKQVQIVLGFEAPSTTSPGRYPMEVLNAILGGMGGRLFADLRDRQSLAYAVQPFYTDSVNAGVFGVYMGVGPGKQKAALAGLYKHLARAAKAPPSPAELKRAKAYLLGGLAVASQSYAGQAARMATDEYLGLGYGYHKKQPGLIQAVTAGQVQAQAKRYLELKHSALLTLGP